MTLTHFLQDEQERLDREWPSARSYTDGRFNEWLSSHDSRLIAKIREMIENERNIAEYVYKTINKSDKKIIEILDHILSLLPDNTKENE